MSATAAARTASARFPTTFLSRSLSSSSTPPSPRRPASSPAAGAASGHSCRSSTSPPDSDPQGIRLALTAHEAPVLRRLGVALLDAPAESVAPWISIAARRLSGDLCLINKVTRNASEDMAGRRGALELPCFENATSISLLLGYVDLAMPPSGVFAQLTYLCLDRIKLCGPDIGDAVSWPRCPVLEQLTVRRTLGLGDFAIHSDSLEKIELDKAFGLGNLTIHSKSLLFLVLKNLEPKKRKDDALGLGNFTIHSESLLWMNMMDVRGMQQLNVLAPRLKSLIICLCFARGTTYNQPVANICAPQLMSLCWNEAYDPSSTHFGNIANLIDLSTFPFHVYGDDSHKLLNSYCVRLLRRFELVQSLRLTLLFEQDITNQQYLMEDITRLPDITSLVLGIRPEEHSFGASVFMFSGCVLVRENWYLQLAAPRLCLLPAPNWRTEELVLNCLKEVEVSDLRGTDHEAALVKRLFDWATVLQTMTVTFDRYVAESKAKEFCQMLQSFSRPEICLKGPHFV